MNAICEIRQGKKAVLLADESMQAVKLALYKLGYEGSFSRAIEDFRCVNELASLPYIDKNTLLAIEQQLGKKISAYTHYYAIYNNKEIIVEEFKENHFRDVFDKKPVNVQILGPADSFSKRLIRLVKGELGNKFKRDSFLDLLFKKVGIIKNKPEINIEYFLQNTEMHFTRAISKLKLDESSRLISRYGLEFYTAERGDIFLFFENACIRYAIVESALADDFITFQLDSSNTLVIVKHNMNEDCIIGFAKAFA